MTKQKSPVRQKSRTLAAAAAAALLATGSTHPIAARLEVAAPAAMPPASLLRTWQVPVFQDMHTAVLILECSRQIGKSHVIGEWAAARLLTMLAQDGVSDWLIVLISNSKANGVELGGKVASALRRAREADERLRAAGIDCRDDLDTARDPELAADGKSAALELDDFAQRIEVRIGNKRGRVLVLAASPRTARGFSGDLGLDEFAFHENAAAMWDAAYPMLDSNPQFVCRVASTHNGVGSLFNTWIKGRVFPVLSVTRSLMWRMGKGDREAWENFYSQWRAIGPKSAAQADAWRTAHGTTPQPHDFRPILSLRQTNTDGSRKELTPDEAQAESTDRASYRQNYENEPAEAGGAFLEWDLITRAEDDSLRFAADVQEWSAETMHRLAECRGGEFFIGQDFARTTDLSAVTVLHKLGEARRQVARLEMRGITVPQQRRQMEALLHVVGNRTSRVVMDSTGNGLGLAEELEDKYGSVILLVNFSQTVPLDEALQADGRSQRTMGIPERMALDLRRAMEDGTLRLMPDAAQREDLRKPARVLKNGKVSVAASRTAADHADRFWAIALAEHGVRAGQFGAWTPEMMGGSQFAIPANPIASLPTWATAALAAETFTPPPGTPALSAA